MPGVFAEDKVIPLEWEEDTEGRQFVDAKIGDLPANTTVAVGTAGVVRYGNGGPEFRMDDSAVAAPKGLWPAVARAAGKKGDTIRVQVYGPVSATFINSMDSRSNKAVVTAAGRLNTGSGGSADNIRWGLVTGSGVNGRTHPVVLDGSPMYT